MTFKVGDRVRRVNCDLDHIHRIGYVGTVAHVHGNGVRVDGLWWVKDNAELVESGPIATHLSCDLADLLAMEIERDHCDGACYDVTRWLRRQSLMARAEIEEGR